MADPCSLQRCDEIAMLVVLAAALAGCGDKTDAEFRAEVIADLHASIAGESMISPRPPTIQVRAEPRLGPAGGCDGDRAMRDAWRCTRIA